MGGLSRSAFRVTQEKVVHSWAMFRLLQRSIVSPGGEDFERTYVSTPGAVGVVAIDDENNVVLVSQYRSSFDAMVLEIPAGMRDVEGEKPEVTAVRELKEETGFSANRIDYLGTMLSSPGVTDSSVEMYVARGLESGALEPHGPEEQEMKVIVVPFTQAIQMVDAFEITDAKSVYGLLMAARRYPELLG
jgi:ADP-ribose pyrophosphatase